MPSITFSVQYQKNLGQAISASELIQLYFFGTPPVDPMGNRIDDQTLTQYIDSAQRQIENYLSLKFQRICVVENRDYVYDDWIQWNYMPTTYPVVAPLGLRGYANSSLQLDYPVEWLSSKKQSPDEDLYHRIINLVPITGSGATVVNGPVGMAPYIGFFGNKTVPNYWEVKYVTGFNKIPADILETIGKTAAISVFTILGDIALGAAIASKSIGIDGLSQAVSSTASAMYSAYSARIGQYEKDIERLKRGLKDRYVGITIGVV